MLPPRFLEFVKTLTSKTERGEFVWSYDDESSVVDLKEPQFSMNLRYTFNSLEECAEYVIYYYDATESKEYRFYTNETWNDYDTIRRLFSAAQASNMKLPF